jgi:hypothetical protein
MTDLNRCSHSPKIHFSAWASRSLPIQKNADPLDKLLENRGIEMNDKSTITV